MIEFIDKMPGTDFMVYFAGFSAVCILLGRHMAGRGRSLGYPMPELTRFDPISIAALRGGWTEAVKTAAFHLWIRRMIAIRGTKEGTKMSLVETKNCPSNPVEREILEFLRVPRRPVDLFISDGLRDRIKGHLRPVDEELQKARLIRTPGERKRAWLVTMVGVGLVGCAGATKIFLETERDRSLLILVTLVLIALIGFVVAVGPMSVISQLGRRYLKALKEQYEWVTHELRDLKVPDGIDSSIAIAVFGVDILPTGITFAAGTAHGDFSAAFGVGKADAGNSGGWDRWDRWDRRRGGGGCGGCGGCGDAGCGGCGGCGE